MYIQVIKYCPVWRLVAAVGDRVPQDYPSNTGDATAMHPTGMARPELRAPAPLWPPPRHRCLVGGRRRPYDGPEGRTCCAGSL